MIGAMTGEIPHWWCVSTHVFFWSDFLFNFKIKNTFIVVFLFLVFRQDTFLRNPLLFFIYSQRLLKPVFWGQPVL